MYPQVQKGKASYYSKRATGARTSSGERLHHDSLTCAHRTYPFGTMLKVTNPSNDKSVIVRVTDRGPFVRGRIIDLSWAAAKELGILAKGVSMVVVEVANEYMVPFKPENDNTLPELDFGSTDYQYSIPETWRERLNDSNDNTQEDKEPLSQDKNKAATTTKEKVGGATKTPPTSQKGVSASQKNASTSQKAASTQQQKVGSAAQQKDRSTAQKATNTQQKSTNAQSKGANAKRNNDK